jgi:hypothetical protein
MPSADPPPADRSAAITYTPTAADLRTRVAPTRTWADAVLRIPYVAHVRRLWDFDLGPGTPPLYLSEVVDPPVYEAGAGGVPLRSVGTTPERALHHLEQRLVQRTAKAVHLCTVLLEEGLDEEPGPRAASPPRRSSSS